MGTWGGGFRSGWMNPRGPGLWQRLAAQFSWGGRASGLGGLCVLGPSGALRGCLYDPGIPRLGVGALTADLLASDSDSVGRGSYV